MNLDVRRFLVPAVIFVVGMALNLPGALYLVALKEIAAADQSSAQDLFQLVIYNVIMFAWAETPSARR